MKIDQKPLAVVLGPTAVGKSHLALEMARAGKERMTWTAEIVSADALQIYKGMDIGTAKPSAYERSLVPHHMIDIVFPDEQYNAGRYEREATEAIDRIHGAGKVPLLVGGCGLYLKAVLHGLFQGPETDLELREELRQEAETHGEYYLHERLKEIDPETAQRLHHKDRPRLIRAIEVYLKTGVPISVLQKDHAFRKVRYRTRIIGLTRDRADLYSRIEKRVDSMIEEGLVAEVEGLLDSGYSENSTALQGLGYKQIVAALKGKSSLENAIHLLKKETRHYAKRQFTWFRQMGNIHWIDLGDCSSSEEALHEMKKVLAGLF
ncbi:MAG: tRNA (adenosine(37)-N6)-dimethylallyltransferase MiaA [bacterium]